MLAVIRVLFSIVLGIPMMAAVVVGVVVSPIYVLWSSFSGGVALGAKTSLTLLGGVPQPKEQRRERPSTD